MKNLKINYGTQLEMAFAAILLLISVLGIISWMHISEISRQATDMYEHPLITTSTLADLKTNVLLVQHRMNDLCLSEDELEAASILQDVDVLNIQIIRDFDVLRNKYLGPKEDIETAFNSYIKWNIIRDRTVSLVRSGKKKEASMLTCSDGKGGMHVELILKNINQIDQRVKNNGNIFYLNALALNKSLKSKMLIWFFCILLTVSIVIVLLIKHLHRPLKELLHATELFRFGDMSVRCKYESENEFGLLAKTLNEFADSLEEQDKLVKKSAEISRMMLSEEDAHKFCRKLLNVLINDTWSQMGALYLLNEDKTKYEYFECIGMNVSGCRPFSAIKKDGEFGKVLETREMQHITNIPDDSRFTFSTVVGEFYPKEIITVPVISSDEIVAVISLANIKRYSKTSVKLILSLMDTLNARMGGILAHQKIVEFSQKLEYQNIELESQKKELSIQTSELQEQNMELEMQKKQLDESNKLKTSFLSNMSHELRTPLNSVIALSGVLGRRLHGKIPDEEYSYIDVIERNGRNLLLLINDILDLSRIESGREEVEIVVFDVNDLIKDIVEMIEPQAIQKNISLSYQENDSLPNIQSDYEKTRHILQNLVANAVKFTEEGSVKLFTEIKDDSISISVIDTGIGIPKESQIQIFEEFRQVDGSTSRKYGGTGLGLSITKKYTELLGGYIEVNSVLGEGSCFTVHLPLQYDGKKAMPKQVEESYLSTITKPQRFTGHVNAGEKTILIVEDTEAIVIQLKDMLESQGYNLMVANSGKEALEQIDHRVPDGMILDLMMPEVDGFQVLKFIRAKEEISMIPVIILTAKYVTKEEFSFLKNNNIHQLIHKGDINKDQLLEAVESMLCKKDETEPEDLGRRIPMPVSGTPGILVVEDNPDNMLTIKALLTEKFRVFEAEDGVTGLRKAKECRPQLILMDIALPGLNGVEVLNHLRRDEDLKDIPVIAVSANAMKGDKEDFLSKGFDGYVSKPIDNQIFTRLIDQWICKD